MGIRKGIRIGNAATAKVFGFIEGIEPAAPDRTSAEDLGVNAQGNVYSAVVRRQMLETAGEEASIAQGQTELGSSWPR